MSSETEIQSRRQQRNSQPSKGDRQERALLESTERLLQATSVSQLTIENIAADAGLSRSSVYFYFANKQQIVHALMELRGSGLLAEAERIEAGEDLRQYIERLVVTLLDTWRNRTTLIMTAVELSTTDQNYRKVWRSYMEQCADGIVRAVEFERAKGNLAPIGEDTGLVAKALLWACERNCYMLFSREHTELEEQQLQATLVGIALRMFGDTA